MARKTLITTLGACILSFGFSQSNQPAEPVAPPAKIFSLRSVKHNAFQVGEKLEYVLHYGFLNAGVATIELQEEPTELQGRKLLHAVGEGHSVGAFKTFYKVNDRYESRFDKDGVFPWVFTRRVNEGGYTIDQDYLYLQHRHQVTTQEKKTFDVPAGLPLSFDRMLTSTSEEQHAAMIVLCNLGRPEVLAQVRSVLLPAIREALTRQRPSIVLLTV